MQPLLRVLTIIGMTICVATPGVMSATAGETVSFPFDPATGESRLYDVVKTRETRRNLQSDQTSTNRLTMSIPITVTGKDDQGFEMRASYNDIAITAPDADDPAYRLATGLARLTEGFGFEFRTTDTGVPVALTNMEAVKTDLLPRVFAKLDDVIAHYTDNPRMAATLDPVRQAFANMSAGAGVQITLRDVLPVFSVTGIELPLNEPLAIHREIPWELTGSNLVVTGEMKITAINEDQATLTLSQSYTRESVRNGIAFLLSQMAGMDKASMERTTKQLRAWEDYDIQTTITATLPRSGGWPTQIDHHQTFIAAGQTQTTRLSYRLAN
ncbi:hypothetical protein [Thalassospira sp. CH_XMU1448-2]|uniref:hypothetical protein n=1 Tax=Thalassospira sp. CH_XMU1448-2 TaxID=3107773 RepID=UPI00300B6BCD